jgi:hypothetical protein
VPAAAVIPAPIAYIQVVAVKKLVVEFWVRSSGLAARLTLLLCRTPPSRELACSLLSALGI